MAIEPRYPAAIYRIACLSLTGWMHRLARDVITTNAVSRSPLSRSRSICSKRPSDVWTGPRPAAPAPGLVSSQPGLPLNRLWRCPVAGSCAETSPKSISAGGS
jgi:hypothetical protein